MHTAMARIRAAAHLAAVRRPAALHLAFAVAFAVALVGAAAQPIGIAVPFNFNKVNGSYEDGLRNLRRLNSEYGIKHVFITGGPGVDFARVNGWQPGLERYVEFAQKLRRIKKDLSDTDLDVWWWNSPTIAYAKGGPFQHMVGGDGREAIHTCCPLDGAFVADVAKRIRCVAEIARPGVILFEDDCHFGRQREVDKFTCYCPLHLAAVSAKIGRRLSHAELVAACENPSEANRPIRAAFAQSMREAFDRLGRGIREAVDEVSPETRMGVSGRHEYARDGNSIFAFTLAVAGKRHRPLLRVAASAYSSDASYHRLIQCFRSSAWAFANMPPEIERMQEIDTYPHNRFFLPDSHVDALLFFGVAFGAESALYYGTPYLDDPLEAHGYMALLRRRLPCLEAYRSQIAGMRLAGVVPLHMNDPDDLRRYHPGGPSSGWGVRMLMRFGIPQTARQEDACASFLIGEEAKGLSDSDARALLEKGGVMMDGAAAAELCARGFADLIGADIRPVRSLTASWEGIRRGVGCDRLPGRNVYSLTIAPATSAERSTYSEIANLRNGAEPLVDFFDVSGKAVAVSAFRFTNAAGGRVAAMAAGLDNNISACLYSPRKKELFRTVFNWLSKDRLPAAVADEPNVSLLVHEGGGQAVLNVAVLRPDVIDGLDVFLSDGLKGPFEELGPDGQWKPVALGVSGIADAVRLPGEFRPCIARIFRCRKMVCPAAEKSVCGF